MHKAKHIASYCILFPIINPSFSYCNRVSPFFITHYISIAYKLLPIFQHLYYFIKPIFPHCSIICPYRSHRLLFVFTSLYFPLWSRLGGGFLRLFSICSCGSHRLLFVICSSFVRHLFVICSSFVRHLFVLPSSFVRHLFVLSSLIVYLPVWLTPACRATTSHCH